MYMPGDADRPAPRKRVITSVRPAFPSAGHRCRANSGRWRDRDLLLRLRDLRRHDLQQAVLEPGRHLVDVDLRGEL